MFEKKNSKKVFKKVEISENVFLGFPKAAAVTCFLFVRIIYTAFFPKNILPNVWIIFLDSTKKKKKKKDYYLQRMFKSLEVIIWCFLKYSWE